jgi:hypothetical protein
MRSCSRPRAERGTSIHWPDPTYAESAAAIADELRSLPPTDAALPTPETGRFV